jgi:hypothetical protein
MLCAVKAKRHWFLISRRMVSLPLLLIPASSFFTTGVPNFAIFNSRFLRQSPVSRDAQQRPAAFSGPQ